MPVSVVCGHWVPEQSNNIKILAKRWRFKCV
jgi:hypothetical protein